MVIPMRRIFGDTKRIDLSTSSFKAMIENDNLYVDKTRFIEHFLNEANTVQLVLRQRRLGKSLNLDTLRCFLNDHEDNRALYKGLYIESSPVWERVNSTPVFYFDFKNLTADNYCEAFYIDVLQKVYACFNTDTFKGYSRILFDSFVNNKKSAVSGLKFLTQLAFDISGKRSVIIIDEYDKMLFDNYDKANYDEMRSFITNVLSVGLKGNEYLEKALLTGVTRVSKESILSGLNNLQVYDMFSDNAYADDFGLTEEEIDELCGIGGFNKEHVRFWYNGIKVGGKPIYNIYAVMSYINYGRLDNYWGRSGAIDIITRHLNDERISTISALMNGETISTHINPRISFKELSTETGDSMFYSLLMQAGYLSLERIEENNIAYLSIPNKELVNVWKDFILSNVIKRSNIVRTIFDNINDVDLFSRDIEYLLSDRLSYFDLGLHDDRTPEKVYHVFVLGILSACADIRYKRLPMSNRESGDGRYDILFETEDFSVIFEFKSVSNEADMKPKADEALKQIDDKRYYADADLSKPLIKTAVVFFRKRCFAKAVRHNV